MKNLAQKIEEPGIEEIMNDPIVALLMKRDGVERDPLLTLLRETAVHLVHTDVKQLQPLDA